MAARFAVAMVLALGVAVGQADAGLRPSPERPEILEIGDPVSINREVLRREMERNAGLRDYIELYGWPDYAEVQEVQVVEPFASYEVRLYFIRRNSYQVFSRVHVGPSVFDYGIRKFEGPISAETLNRLLTAHAAPVEEEVAVAPAPVAEAAPMPEPVVAVAAEPVEEVVAPANDLETVITRLEAAAERAAIAADRAEVMSASAAASADRATGSLERAVQQYGQ